MDQRGRKSSESLAVITTMPGQRCDPPACLSEREAAEWQRIVSCHPYDWFPASTHGLLKDYCRALVKSDDLARRLDGYEEIPAGGKELMVWLRLCDRQDKNARLMTTLATKMRITNQSMRTERQAATGVKLTSQEVRKPWEYGVDAG